LEFRPPDAARAARCVKEATGAQHMASAAPASLSCWSATIRRRTPKCAKGGRGENPARAGEVRNQPRRHSDLPPA